MRPLREYLARFSHLHPPEKVVKDAVIESVERVCGITLKPGELKVSGSKVSLKTDSIRRSEIMLHKGAILRALADALPGKRVVRDLS